MSFVDSAHTSAHVRVFVCACSVVCLVYFASFVLFCFAKRHFSAQKTNTWCSQTWRWQRAQELILFLTDGGAAFPDSELTALLADHGRQLLGS